MQQPGYTRRRKRQGAPTLLKDGRAVCALVPIEEPLMRQRRTDELDLNSLPHVGQYRLNCLPQSFCALLLELLVLLRIAL